MNLWPVEHFCPHFLSGSALIWKKVFNWPEVHLYWSNFLWNPYFNWFSLWCLPTTSETLLYMDGTLLCFIKPSNVTKNFENKCAYYVHLFSKLKFKTRIFNFKYFFKKQFIKSSNLAQVFENFNLSLPTFSK